MKKLRFLSVFTIIAALSTLTGCSDDKAELLNGGQGGNGTVMLNVNYTIPGDDTARLFTATYVTANANTTDITINAENEDTGETMVIAFTGNKVQNETQPDAYEATITYTDADGVSYTGFSPFQNMETGAAKLFEINTTDHTITGAFSFIGFNGTETAALEGTPFYSGVFINIPYTGSLPETPTTPGTDPTPGTNYMKATVDGTQVNFATLNTLASNGSTSFTGTNMTPMTMLQLIFFDNTVLVEGAVLSIDADADAQIIVGTNGYFADSGTVTVTDITDGIITGTFSFSASDIDGIETVQITAGEFKMPLQ